MYYQIFTFCLLICLTHSYLLPQNKIPHKKYMTSFNKIEHNSKPSTNGKYFHQKYPFRFSENSPNSVEIKPSPANVQRYPVRFPDKSVANNDANHRNDEENRNLVPNSVDYNNPDLRIQGRMWGIDNEVEMCKSRRVIINPFEDQEKDSVWDYLFNNGTSAVEGEECVNPGGGCTLDIFGFVTKCVQKYSYKVLIHIEEGVTVEEKFRIPSGCICVYNK